MRKRALQWRAVHADVCPLITSNLRVVEHPGILYGITGSGQRMAVYSANFAPADVAHDTPILAEL
jgi:hypothetical protein